MEYAEAKQITNKYPGMRMKLGKDDNIILYGNVFTLISDIWKYLKKL